MKKEKLYVLLASRKALKVDPSVVAVGDDAAINTVSDNVVPFQYPEPGTPFSADLNARAWPFMLLPS